MATLNHNWGAPTRPLIPAPHSSSRSLSLPAGPPPNRGELIAHHGSAQAYKTALASAKKARRAAREAEAALLRRGLFDGRLMSLTGFKTECRTLLDNLQAIPNGRPKTPEQLAFHVAQFAQIWFRMGQQSAKEGFGADDDSSEAEHNTAKGDPLSSELTARLVPAPLPFAGSKEGRAADPIGLGNMEFNMAANAWLRMQSARIRQSTVKGYVQYIKQLRVYFGGMRLCEIHHGHLSEYQVCRSGNTGGDWYKPTDAAPTPWTKPSCVSNTNHELNTLQQMLRAAKLWAPLADHYKPLPPTGFKKPKVMSDEEITRFFVLASSRPEWKVALWVATISHHTGATGVELRSLRIGDVAIDCAKPCLYINAETAKCRNRGREIQLMPDAVNALRNCIARAKSLGSFRDDHYIFPFYLQRNVHDVTRPATQSWITRPWRELREAAGLPWLTPHCLRHQCLTELHENNVPPEVIRKIAGHLSPAMTDHYSHVRRKQQEEALSKISSLSSIMNPAVGSKAAASKPRAEVARLARGRRVLRTLRTA